MTTSSGPSSSSRPRASFAPPVPPANRTTGATAAAPYNLRRRMRLAALTTLRLGGPAGRLVEALTEADLVAAVRERPALVLAGGSNVVIADEGVPGTVVLVRTRGIDRDGNRLVVQAGGAWGGPLAHTPQRGPGGGGGASRRPGGPGGAPRHT